MKDGEKFSSPMPLQKIHSDLFEALFSVDPVTPNQRWRFTCYGYSSSSPQLWSMPSNQVELLVSGKEAQYFECNCNWHRVPGKYLICGVIDNQG